MIRHRRTTVRSRQSFRPRTGGRPAAMSATPDESMAAPLSFSDRPAPGRNNVLWLGPTASPTSVVNVVERVTGYRVSALWRLSHGGWQAHLPGGDSAIRLVDALDRLVVVLDRAA